MKDIVIKGSDIRRELYILLGSFIAACAVNIGTIIAYDRPWSELYSQIGYVVFLSIIIYFLLFIIRMLLLLVRKIFTRK